MKSNIKILLVTAIISVLIIQVAYSATLRVPDDYSSIQQAIDSSDHGDTVLVSSGTYTENVIFRGKNIVLTSRYLIDDDYNLIFTTIIDGSSPADADSASCVRFMHGEDSTAVIEGFTLTGGAGTVHPDVDPNYVWREGGAILAYYASPTIKNNYITGNTSSEAEGLSGAGGGGVAFFKSHNPLLINNIICFNTGNQYAPGVSVDKAGAIIRNNIIARNSGASTYGGGGIWVLEEGSYPVYIDNNTIVWNESAQSGAGLLVWNASVTARNNILWGNEHSQQIKLTSATLDISHSLVQNGYASGDQIIETDPAFENNQLYLSSTSPAVDAGLDSSAYNDIEDPENSGNALLPSLGTTRNDLGAFGGPTPLMFTIDIEPLIIEQPDALEEATNSNDETSLYVSNLSATSIIHYRGVLPNSFIEVYSIHGILVASFAVVTSEGKARFSTAHLKSGNFIIKARGRQGYTSVLARL